VGALAAEPVQVERQAGDERLALAGLHLGDLAPVEDYAAHHLDVEVAEPDGPLGGFPDQRERLD